MSIASKLQDILAAKADIKDAINAKGGTITDATPLDEYAQAIEDLPSGGLDEYLTKQLQGQLTEIRIPQGVVNIGAYACYNQIYCTYIHIPSSVRTIGNNAFFKGSDITQEVVLEIDNGVTEIQSLAFRMNNIKRVVLPDSLVTLAAQAFMFCYQIEYVEFGTDITSIGVNNFIYTRRQNMVIVVKATTPPTLSGSLFPNNYTTGKIYVPDASVNDYKTATNWSTYASYIYPLSDYQP